MYIIVYYVSHQSMSRKVVPTLKVCLVVYYIYIIVYYVSHQSMSRKVVPTLKVCLAGCSSCILYVYNCILCIPSVDVS